MGDIVKLCVILGVVCVLNGLALGYVYDATRAAVERTEAATLASSLEVVLPAAERFSGEKAARLPGGGTLRYYEGTDGAGKTVGWALATERQGYQSTLKILVGVDPAGVIRGMKILAQGETPGLGARVDEVAASGTLWGAIAGAFRRGDSGGAAAVPPRPWFQEQYKGLDAAGLNLLRAGQGGKGIHAITGATITSRAVTDGVKDAVEQFMACRGGSRG